MPAQSFAPRDANHLIRGGSVSVKSVSRRYGPVVALDNISLDVIPGEFLALLGPSGSGKTSLLMTIAGFETPDSGSILLDNRDITRHSPDQRNLGMVFQRYALFPHMSLLDNVAFPLRMRGVGQSERRARAEAALDTVGLSGFGSRLPAQLSGGQQQRVALARAIVFEPPVLLMDEPLSALDKNLRERMRLEIKHLQKRLCVTVIFVTHDQEEALVMADRIVVMNRGRVIEQGTPQTLYRRPNDSFVAGFLGETNFIDAEVADHRGDGLVVRFATGALVEVAADTVPRSAKAVRLAVRPEAINVSPGPLEAGRLCGHLAEIIFAGNAQILLIDIGLVEPIAVRRPYGVETEALREGDQVQLHWHADDVRVFPAEDVR